MVSLQECGQGRLIASIVTLRRDKAVIDSARVSCIEYLLHLPLIKRVPLIVSLLAVHGAYEMDWINIRVGMLRTDEKMRMDEKTELVKAEEQASIESAELRRCLQVG